MPDTFIAPATSSDEHDELLADEEDEELDVDVDGVVYPVEDEMGGESGLHYFLSRRLVDLLADFVRRTGVPGVVGGEQFFYYRRGDPRGVACPDGYLLLGETMDVRDIESWKLWDHAGKAPDIAVEVVSRTYRKDYKTRLIERYEEMGVRELIRYDPKPVHGRTYTRRHVSQFLRNARGRLVMQRTSDVRVRSAVLPDLWFVHHADDGLRIHTGANGATKWPTPAERAAAEVMVAATARVAAEAEARDAAAARLAAEAEMRDAAAARRAAEAEVRAAEAEVRAAEAEVRAAEAEVRDATAARREAEAEVERLRAELARLRGG